MILKFKKIFSIINRPKSAELEQALIRMIFVSLIILYLVLNHSSAKPIYVCLIYLSVSFLNFVWISFNPKKNEKRQWLSMFMDVAATSYEMTITQAMGGVFIGIYLWLSIGYGLRYGPKYTKGAYAASLIGFVVSIQLNSYWSNHLDLAYGFLLTLILIPLHTLRLQNKLELAIESARSANKAKSQFLSHMSHEMRTPLNGIVGASDLLLSTKQNDEQRNFTYLIKSSSILLRQLINDVLDIAKIEQGKMDVSVIDFDLYDLVHEIDVIFKQQAEQKKLTYSFTVSSNCHPTLKGDYLHIKQVLINLVSNAVKFTETGSVEIRVSEIQSYSDITVLRFSVRDTGIGIKAEAQAKIFESFTQADNSISNKFGGTGLGTAISKQLIEIMGGDISFRSEYGVGSEFSFELKLEKQYKSPISENDSPVMEVANSTKANVLSFKDHVQRNKKITILIADDSLTNRIILSKMLSMSNYIVHAAENGEQALDMLEMIAFDLMILDLNMPLMSGIEVVQVHRSLSRTRIPSIILTADATMDAKNRCDAAEIDALLTKPYDSEALLKAVDRITSQTSTSNVVRTTNEKSVSSQNDKILLINEARLHQLKALDNSSVFINKLVNAFIADTEAALRTLQIAIVNENFVEFKDTAHALAGNASNMGTDKFCQICYMLNHISPSDDVKSWKQLLAKAELVFKDTKTQLLIFVEKIASAS